MREIVAIPCEDGSILATIDGPADATIGWVFATGGSQTRLGPHRLYERLAAGLAAQGHAAIRFDRRGVGDSAGTDGGYLASTPDIAAAAAALRVHAPQITRLLGFGLCDGATALGLFGKEAGIEAVVLANPWVIEPRDELPPAAAIRGYYRKRLTDPRAWLKLIRGGVDLGRLTRGLARMTAKEDHDLARRLAKELPAGATTIVLAQGDGTAQAFREAWLGLAKRPRTKIVTVATTSHSFSPPPAFAKLAEALAAAAAIPPL